MIRLDRCRSSRGYRNRRCGRQNSCVRGCGMFCRCCGSFRGRTSRRCRDLKPCGCFRSRGRWYCRCQQGSGSACDRLRGYCGRCRSHDHTMHRFFFVRSFAAGSRYTQYSDASGCRTYCQSVSFLLRHNDSSVSMVVVVFCTTHNTTERGDMSIKFSKILPFIPK